MQQAIPGLRIRRDCSSVEGKGGRIETKEKEEGLFTVKKGAKHAKVGLKRGGGRPTRWCIRRPRLPGSANKETRE